MICQKYISLDVIAFTSTSETKMHHFVNFQWQREAKMAIFKLSSILKNSSALGSFNCIFENNSLKALFRQNVKKLRILNLSSDSQ